MPQPVPFKQDAQGFRSFPRVLLERQRLAALIGAIAAEWGYIDHMLVQIFDAAVSHPGGKYRHVNPVNVAVFETLGALRPKLDIIERVLRMRVPKPIADKFVQMRKDIRKSAGERAFYVHASWSISDDFPNDLIITSGQGNVRYQEHDFLQTLDRMVAMRLTVHNFYMGVQASIKLEP